MKHHLRLLIIAQQLISLIVKFSHSAHLTSPLDNPGNWKFQQSDSFHKQASAAAVRMTSLNVSFIGFSTKKWNQTIWQHHVYYLFFFGTLMFEMGLHKKWIGTRNIKTNGDRLLKSSQTPACIRHLLQHFVPKKKEMKNTENMNYLVLGCIFEPYTCQVFSDGFVPNTKKGSLSREDENICWHQRYVYFGVCDFLGFCKKKCLFGVSSQQRRRWFNGLLIGWYHV